MHNRPAEPRRPPKTLSANLRTLPTLKYTRCQQTASNTDYLAWYWGKRWIVHVQHRTVDDHSMLTHFIACEERVVSTEVDDKRISVFL